VQNAFLRFLDWAVLASQYITGLTARVKNRNKSILNVLAVGLLSTGTGIWWQRHSVEEWPYEMDVHNEIQYTIRDASFSLTCAQKPTWVSLIYRAGLGKSGHGGWKCQNFVDVFYGCPLCFCCSHLICLSFCVNVNVRLCVASHISVTTRRGIFRPCRPWLGPPTTNDALPVLWTTSSYLLLLSLFFRHTKLWLQRQFTLLPWCGGKKPPFVFAELWKVVGKGCPGGLLW